ncbi:MAG TPA: hypothetical protein VMD74_00315 [Candidatus Methylomirabilis sp.]|nr:hypothetical protein [Candidatus Methylomirabilis sp.]
MENLEQKIDSSLEETKKQKFYKILDGFGDQVIRDEQGEINIFESGAIILFDSPETAAAAQEIFVKQGFSTERDTKNIDKEHVLVNF